jgi:hypothetical protein
MLTRYAKDDNLKTSMEPFLREFLYILTYGNNKYKDFTWNIEGIYKKRPNEICKLLTAVIVENVITVREEEKNILQHCLNILIQIASCNNSEFRCLSETLYDIVPSEENEYVLSDIFEKSLYLLLPYLRIYKNSLKNGSILVFKLSSFAYLVSMYMHNQ